MTEILARTLHDIAQVLESIDGSEARLYRVLQLIPQIAPAQHCALLVQGEGERGPHVTVAPEASPEDKRALVDKLMSLHAQLGEERVHPPALAPKPLGAHLAVPIVGNDRVIGVLFVSGSPPGGYTEQHLRELSVIGAQVAAYLVIVDQARCLEAARSEACAANRMKDEFLALVSHAMKTPLTSMLAWVRTLNRETGTAGRARAVEAIERNVRIQEKLVDEILNLACIVAADLRLDFEVVRPVSLIKAAVEQQRLRATQRSIRLETALDESVDKIVVDPARIVQVVSSLVGNAIDFTPPGGQVGVRLERAGAHARIQVTDAGKGIPAEVLPQMFLNLRGGRNAVAHGPAEPSVPLATVKTLVEAHGGQVRAESLGEAAGSTFTVELPLPLESLQRLAGVRVLLVDDDAEMRMAVKAVLENDGADVIAVASVATALAALELSKPHMLLTDLSIQGGAGYDLMREVAARDDTLPVAALAGSGRHAEEMEARKAGFHMYLAKPVDAQALVTAVARLCVRVPAIAL